MANAALRLLRPKQWTKGLLVFAAPLFTRRLFDGPSFTTCLIAFFAMALLSSATYVANDAFDAERDRRHPTKRKRPIASGEITIQLAAVIGIGCLIGGLALSIALGTQAVVIAATYLCLQMLYNFALKHVPIADVFILASGYVLRAALGAAAIQVTISGWLLMCTGALALLVGIGKRRSELRLQTESGVVTRESLNLYTIAGLDALLTVAASAAVMSYGVYSLESDTAKLNPGLVVTSVWVFFAVFRYVYLVIVSGAGEEPELLLFKDRQILFAVVLFLITAAVAMTGLNPWMLGRR